MNPELKGFLLTKYNNCVKLVIHNESLQQRMLRFYFAFVAVVFILLGFITSLVAIGQQDFAGLIAAVTKEFDVVGGIAIILVIFTLCLGVCCLYFHRQLKLKNINHLKAMGEIAQAMTPEEHVDPKTSPYSTAGTDIYYARIFAFSNSVFLLCLIVLLGMFTKLAVVFQYGLIITMILAGLLAIIFYFIQLEVIYLGYLRG